MSRHGKTIRTSLLKQQRSSCVVNLGNCCHVFIEMGDGRHEIIDLRNMELGRIIAEKLKKQPELLALARSNLERWIAQSHGTPPPAHLEWKGILEKMHPDEIMDLLTQDSEDARRLRQSNPFAGALTPQERWSVLKAYETGSA